jgi:hypothetical protein
VHQGDAKARTGELEGERSQKGCRCHSKGRGGDLLYEPVVLDISPEGPLVELARLHLAFCDQKPVDGRRGQS